MPSISQDQFLDRLYESLTTQFGDIPKVNSAIDELRDVKDLTETAQHLKDVSKAFVTEFAVADDHLQKAMKTLQSELLQDDLESTPATVILTGLAARFAEPFDKSLMLLDPAEELSVLLSIPEVAQRMSLDWIATVYLPVLRDFKSHELMPLFHGLPDEIFAPDFLSFHEALSESITSFMRFPAAVEAMLSSSSQSRVHAVRTSLTEVLDHDAARSYSWLQEHAVHVSTTISTLSDLSEYLSQSYANLSESVRLINSLPTDTHETALNWMFRRFPHGLTSPILEDRKTISVLSGLLQPLDAANLLPALIRSTPATVMLVTRHLKGIQEQQSAQLAEALAAARTTGFTNPPPCQLLLFVALRSPAFSAQVYRRFEPFEHTRSTRHSQHLYDPTQLLNVADRLRQALESKSLDSQRLDFPRWNDSFRFKDPVIYKLSPESFCDLVHARFSAQYLEQVVDLPQNKHVRDALPFIDHLRSLTDDLSLIQQALDKLPTIRHILLTLRSEEQLQKLLVSMTTKSQSLL